MDLRTTYSNAWLLGISVPFEMSTWKTTTENLMSLSLVSVHATWMAVPSVYTGLFPKSPGDPEGGGGLMNETPDTGHKNVRKAANIEERILATSSVSGN